MKEDKKNWTVKSKISSTIHHAIVENEDCCVLAQETLYDILCHLSLALGWRKGYVGGRRILIYLGFLFPSPMLA